MSNDSKKCPVTHLTTDFGAPVVTNRDSLTAGPRGPLLAQDTWLNEKLANFVREVIPERRMHAKGSGAFGTFTVTNDISKYTRASIFSEVGKETEMFANLRKNRGTCVLTNVICDCKSTHVPLFFLRLAKKQRCLRVLVPLQVKAALPMPNVIFVALH